MTRVIIIDDQPAFRRQLRLLLDHAGLDVIAEAETIDEAKELVRQLQPDLAIVDVMLPGTSGLEGTPQLKALADHLRVILISAYQNFHRAAEKAGAEAFVSKENLDIDTVRSWGIIQKENGLA